MRLGSPSFFKIPSPVKNGYRSPALSSPSPPPTLALTSDELSHLQNALTDALHHNGLCIPILPPSPASSPPSTKKSSTATTPPRTPSDILHSVLATDNQHLQHLHRSLALLERAQSRARRLRFPERGATIIPDQTELEQRTWERLVRRCCERLCDPDCDVVREAELWPKEVLEDALLVLGEREEQWKSGAL